MRKIGIGIGIAVTAVMLAVGAAAPATAQNTPLVLSNYMAWWDAMTCTQMLHAVNAVTNLDTAHSVFANNEDSSGTGNAAADSKRQWCHMFADLGTPEQEAVKAAATRTLATGGITTKASDSVYDMTGWWTGMNAEGRAIAIGYDDDTDDTNTLADPGATLTGLTNARHTEATAAFNALKGDAKPADPTPTPAVPLVGVLLLGAGLAARGAFLRRRR